MLLSFGLRANRKEMEEEKKMCEALRELFADELEQSRTEGMMEGRFITFFLI